MNTGTYLRNLGNNGIHLVPKRTEQEIYCGRCHLATPTWRGKCIHCAEPLPLKNVVTAKPAVVAPVVLKRAQR